MPKTLNPEIPADYPNQTKPALARVLTKDVGSLLLSLSLFIGGIVLLALRLPFWSLFLGLPAVQIGIVFAIFAFDRISQNSLDLNGYHEVNCSVCERAMLAPDGVAQPICRECRRKKRS